MRAMIIAGASLVGMWILLLAALLLGVRKSIGARDRHSPAEPGAAVSRVARRLAGAEALEGSVVVRDDREVRCAVRPQSRSPTQRAGPVTRVFLYRSLRLREGNGRTPCPPLSRWSGQSPRLWSSTRRLGFRTVSLELLPPYRRVLRTAPQPERAGSRRPPYRPLDD
jgi:hypothetical protein